MKMRVHIFSCLLAFVLGCNVTAAIHHEVLEEKNPVTLRCPHSVEGQVTWSRESSGSNVDILTVDGNRDIKHIHDPFRRYSSLADKFKSLYISRVTVSDTGRYLCNNKPAVELTVIPSGTSRLTAPQGTSVSLTCPSEVAGPHAPTWIRLNSGTNITVSSHSETDEHASHRTRIQYSTEEKTLTITDVQPDDAGLYYCDGEAAAYLNVTEGDQPERAAVLVLGVLLPLLLIIFIILFLTWRCRIKRRGSGGQRGEVVYAQITDGLAFEPTQDGSNQHDLTYSIIHHLDEPGNKTVTFQPNETLYSLINKPHLHGKNEGHR